MNESARVCVVGSLHYDIMVQAPYLPRTGETLMGEAWWWKPGGKGGNQAMAAARHGAATALIGCLGSDGFGLKLRERLGLGGVDLAHVRSVLQGSGMSVAIQQDDGDYAAVVVSGANREIDTAQVNESAVAICDSRVLLLQNEIGAAANVAAARLAREAGVTVVLNAAPARSMGDMGGQVDVLVVNAVEAEMLGSSPVHDLDGAAKAAGELRSLAPVVIVTAGPHGVAAAVPQSVTVQPHVVDEAETHGAGDVFAGALGARLAVGSDIGDALRYANAAAALHVGTPAAERDALSPADVGGLLAASA